MAHNAITITGNLTADPESMITADGATRTRFSVAVSHPIRRADGTWDDYFDGFFNVICWRSLGDNTAATLHKGDRVVVSGRLQRRPYEHKNDDGTTDTRHVIEIDAEEVGPSLRFNRWLRQKTRQTDTFHTPPSKDVIVAA